MAALPVIYSPEYNVTLPGTGFLATKYGYIVDRLVADGVLAAGATEEADYADESTLHLVHTRDYIRKLRTGMLRLDEASLIEAPWSPALVRATWRTAGGAILAARRALEHGLSVHVGGGFGHAFADHGEFFSLVNDTAIALRRLLADGAIERALVVNCDVHQANGIAAVFADDPRVTTFSIHQENNFPYTKQTSTCDVALYEGEGREPYMRALQTQLPLLLETSRPSIVVYIAGADPYVHDRSGGLCLTMGDLVERDRYVIDTVRGSGAPLTISLGGGDAKEPHDTVAIHVRTIALAAERAEREHLVSA